METSATETNDHNQETHRADIDAIEIESPRKPNTSIEDNTTTRSQEDNVQPDSNMSTETSQNDESTEQQPDVPVSKVGEDIVDSINEPDAERDKSSEEVLSNNYDKENMDISQNIDVAIYPAVTIMNSEEMYLESKNSRHVGSPAETLDQTSPNETRTSEYDADDEEALVHKTVDGLAVEGDLTGTKSLTSKSPNEIAISKSYKETIELDEASKDEQPLLVNTVPRNPSPQEPTYVPTMDEIEDFFKENKVGTPQEEDTTIINRAVEQETTKTNVLKRSKSCRIL